MQTPPRPSSTAPTDSVVGRSIVDSLADPVFARRYSGALGTAHLPVGGACALQHYAGHFALAVLRVGHTVAVDRPRTGVNPRSTYDVAACILDDHLRPIAQASYLTSRITERVALGCIAASCAVAFGDIGAQERRAHIAEHGATTVFGEDLVLGVHDVA